MLGMFLVLALLTAFLWLLVKLRDIRELSSGPPNDETTLVLGLFYAICRASIHFFRDRGRYPALISGARDGLYELGYLKKEPIANETPMVQLFSIVVSQDVGYGICLYNCSPSLTNGLLDRLDKSGGRVKFFHYDGTSFVPINRPTTHTISLTLPLPTKPTSAGKRSA